jgi:hypothetical protein
VQTIWKTYPVIRGILVLILILAALLWLMKKWLRTPYPFPPIPRAKNWFTKTLYTLAILSMVTVGMRGSWTNRPMQRKDAASTADPVLNRCVVNPFSALNYAIKAHLDLIDSQGLENYLDRKEVRAAFLEYSGKPNLNSVDEAFLRTASGPTGSKPKHIILVLLESGASAARMLYYPEIMPILHNFQYVHHFSNTEATPTGATIAPNYFFNGANIG